MARAPFHQKAIGIIGAGTIGQALIKGLLAHGCSRRTLCAADPSAAARARVGRRFRIDVTDENLQVVRRSEIVILAVKPQQFPGMLDSVAPGLLPAGRHGTRGPAPPGGAGRGRLVISVAAGIRLRWLEARLPGVAVIRVMPNLPVTVGFGFSAITLGRWATARHRAIAFAIFNAVGEAVELPESLFDAVTAVSGSGPTYLFFLIQAWEEAARALGLPSAVSHQAIRKTLEGSLRLWQVGGASAETLIGQVASKGGTTEAALRVLAKRRVAARFTEALRAAARRSRELSWS
jgi:pyrroline-5-carboxylate reductase